MKNDYCAIYLDLENIVLSAHQIFPMEDYPISIETMLDYISERGTVSIKRAYANWTNYAFKKYQKELVEQGFDLVHLPETYLKNKSWADVRLTIDLLEDMAAHPHVSQYYIGSNDTDFVPVLQKILQRGHEAIVLGFDEFANNILVKNCSEFADLVEVMGKADRDQYYDVDTLLQRFLKSWNLENEMPMAAFKPALLKLNPAFSEKKAGHNSFFQFVQSLKPKYVSDIRAVGEGPAKAHFISFSRPKGDSKPSENKLLEDARGFLAKNLKFISKAAKRKEVFTYLLERNAPGVGFNLNEIIEDVSQYSEVPQETANRLIFQLIKAGVLVPMMLSEDGQQADRRFVIEEGRMNAEEFDNQYLARVKFILSQKFQQLGEKVIMGMLGMADTV